MSEQAAVAEFKKRFDHAPQWLAIAPGRINLIGEHTDYNDGFVFPAAIDRQVILAAAETDRSTTLHSEELGDADPFDATNVDHESVSGWGKYPAGVAWALRESVSNDLQNVEGSVSSDLPVGAGLSSSAALEMAFAVLWNELGGCQLENAQLALLSQKAENDFVGVQCGIMDQMASAMGKAGHAMFLDTRSLEITYVPMPKDLCVVICDTGTPRALSSSAYNERRAQCRNASRILHVDALRDATMEMLEHANGALPETMFRRARHVITENERCLQFAEALKHDDKCKLGALMRASHESLRVDFEVSSRELDLMAATAWDAPGCVGARMTGAGFGGACVALVEERQLEDFTSTVLSRYNLASAMEGTVTVCKLVDGARACKL